MHLLLNKMNSHLLRTFSPSPSVPISKPPSVRSRRANTKSTRNCSTSSFTPHGGDTVLPDHAPVHRSGQRLQPQPNCSLSAGTRGTHKSFRGIQEPDIHTLDTLELPRRWRNTLKTQEKKLSENQTSLEGGSAAPCPGLLF